MCINRQQVHFSWNQVIKIKLDLIWVREISRDIKLETLERLLFSESLIYFSNDLKRLTSINVLLYVMKKILSNYAITVNNYLPT